VLHQIPEGARGARRTMVSAAPLLDQARSVIYFIANQDHGCTLHAWSISANRILWSHALKNAVQATPALTQTGTVLVPDLGGSVHGIAPNGSPQFEYRSGCEYLLAGAVSERGGTAWIGDPTGVLHQIDAHGEGRRFFQLNRAIQARASFDPAGKLYVPCTDGRVYVFPATDAA